MDSEAAGQLSAEASTPPRRVLFPILLVSFIGTLGFSIVLPFLVTLVTKLGGNALVYGLMGATYSSFQLVGAPVLGSWSDRYGRRRILLLSQLGTLASWVVFLAALFVPVVVLLPGHLGLGLSLPLVLIFGARALDGLTGGNVSVANAYLADITTESQRTESFGKMAVATNLGFIVGPMLAGLLGATRWGEVLPVLAALAISLMASLVIAFYLPDSSPCRLEAPPERTAVRRVFGQEQRNCYETTGEKRLGWRGVLALEGVTLLFVLYFLIFLGFNLFYTGFPVHSVRGLGWDTPKIGAFFSFLGLTTVVVQGPILSRISKLVSSRGLVLAGSAILTLGLWGMSATSDVGLYLAAALFSLGNGLMWPSFLTVLSRVAGPTYQGAVQGLGGSVGSLASVFGLVAGGILYDALGSAVFWASGSLIALVFLVSALTLRDSWRGGRQSPPPAPPGD